MKKILNQKLAKILLIILMITLIITYLIIIIKNNYKNLKTGNNTNTEIINNILNINSYKANVLIIITSNKNKNEYKITQEVIGESYNKQETEEPEEIKGMQITYDNGTVEIKNTQLSLSKIYENYPDIQNNDLFLTTFINEYKKCKSSKVEETKEEITMTINNQKNKYSNQKLLKIDRQTQNPKELIIYDNNKQEKIDILYSEIELNI